MNGKISLYYFLFVLLLISCGPEAPPRAIRPGSVPTANSPLIAQAKGVKLLSEQKPDPRTKGDPSAPIVVIEYGDYQ